jgi:hypothetical protein
MNSSNGTEPDILFRWFFGCHSVAKFSASLDPEIRFASYNPICPNFRFCKTPTNISQAAAATQTADAAAEASVAATFLTAESGAEATAQQHGTTFDEVPAAGGGRIARRPVSTLPSPFGMGTAARTGKENINYLTPLFLTVNNTTHSTGRH